MEYAIVDIETTGGYASGGGITEIAIVVHDGVKVIDRFETLINPQQPIPYFIQVLTGIDDGMVSSMPLFGEVAEKIYSMLMGRVFVAHHVNFDYSFIRYSLGKAGFEYNSPKLCTVRMGRKIKPGLPSYSLGRLCTFLGIQIINRHRAGGDADATAILFSRLLEWDVEGHIQAMLKGSGDQQLPPNLPREEYEKLPLCPGVYYFRDEHAKVVYVGKALSLKKRVASHFSGNNTKAQRQNFLKHIYSITYETCGNELMALLLEALEIKRLWPVFNRAMKKFEPRFALYCYEDGKGYLRLAIGKHGKYQTPEMVFNNQLDAYKMLNRLRDEFKLDSRFCHFYNSKSRQPMILHEWGNELLETGAYNARVQSALESVRNEKSSFGILDRGRNEDERSLIWVEKGELYAMGYVNGHPDMNGLAASLASLQRVSANHYMTQLVYAYAEKHPWKIIKH